MLDDFHIMYFILDKGKVIDLDRQGEWKDSSEWLQNAKLLWKCRDKENAYRLAILPMYVNPLYECQFDCDS